MRRFYTRLALVTSLAWSGSAGAATITVKEYPVAPGTQAEVPSLNDRHEALVNTTKFDSEGTLSVSIRAHGLDQEIPFPGNAELGLGIMLNDAGAVVGTYNTTANDGTTIRRGFLYQANVFLTLDDPGASTTYPDSINDSGEVAGSSGWSDPPFDRGFVFMNGVFSPIVFPGASYTVVDGISADGHVYGYATFASGRPVRAFTWKAGVFHHIIYPGSIATRVTAGSKNGLLAGTVTFPDYSVRAFIYDRGIFSLIPAPQGIGIHPAAINDSGAMVGENDLSGSERTTFYYSPSAGYVTVPTNASGISPTLNAINDAGVMSGSLLDTPDGPLHPVIARCAGSDC